MPRSSPSTLIRTALRPSVVAVLVLCQQLASAQTSPQSAAEPAVVLKLAPRLSRPDPSKEPEVPLPIVLQARSLSGRPDLETIAEGDVELRRGSLVIRADELRYETVDDMARASGHVSVLRDGNRFEGPELQLKLQRFEGFFLSPRYHFDRVGAGGQARRIDFEDDQRLLATGATYTSCPTDGSGGPAWLLSTDRVRLDFETNEGVAEGAVLRFYGVPILASPILSFPLNDQRKSGWLPPTINLDTKSGLQVAVPYYWNLAPNRDMTFTPMISAKRGLGLETEFRYLEAHHEGSLNLNALPRDGLTGRSRYALNLANESSLPGGINLQARSLRVSDDDYWKDFPRSVPSLTPRLLSTELQLNKAQGNWNTYARVQAWQVLQDATSLIEAPYQRLPQIGARYAHRDGLGFEVGLEAEFNHFTNPADGVSSPRPTGLRVHALGSVARPFVEPGWTLTPKLAFNAASYALDQDMASGGRTATRIIPTASLDSAWLFERDTTWFGNAARQTLEPRLLYVNTPYRNQSELPNFDAAGKDFNFESTFAENAFSGVDRVSDAHQLTAGLTTRLLDPASGAEKLRLGVVQRYLFRDQRVTPDGTVLTQRLSDLLLLGSTTAVPDWTLGASVQYSPDNQRTVRSNVSARYSPGPYRTFGVTYRLARGLSEQVEFGWQWPLLGAARAGAEGANRAASALGNTNSSECGGRWYTVGRINYSTQDNRVTDSVLGLEYDSGCWIGRIVAERLSTGQSEATTRLLFQLELVGLSRLGSNPLQVLKDNIPGYRLLREERGTTSPRTTYD